MSEIKSHIQDMIAELRQERDALRVKVKLARMEAGDEWEKLEAKLAKLEAKAKELGGATADASHDIGAAAKLLGEELRKGFKSIASHF